MQLLDMKTECDGLDIKYYAKDQDKIEHYVSASYLDFVEIGVMVVSTVASLITIAKFLKKNDGERNSLINIQLFNKTKNNTYIYHNYNGNVDEFYNSVAERMIDDFEHK